MLSFRETLIKYIDLGFNLIPVKSDKRPAIHSWTRYQTERVTLEDFMDMYHDAKRKGIAVTGVAVITGKISGITVVDLDVGSTNPFSDTNTMVTRTGSGGSHYFFKYTDKLSTTSNQTLKIDIRNDGGYAILPPSKTDKGNYSLLTSYELLDVPSSFLDLYTSGIVKNSWSFEGTAEGGRNNRSKSVIGALLKATKDPETSWELFQGWNQLNTPPIEQEQLLATFNWCVNKDLSNKPKEAQTFSSMTDEELLTFTQRDRARVNVEKIDDSFEHYAGFYVICANPGVGKGWYALWLIRRFYETSNIRSVYFSLEMSEELVRERVLQAWSDVDNKALKYLIKNKKEIKALEYLKKDVIAIDEFGGSDTSQLTTENFVDKIKHYYDKGYRAFHFDHLHEIDGANDNLRNQSVTEKWAKVFQGICKDYQDIWLFVYAQPNGASAKKQLLKRTDIAGSKAITQKCEFFISLNRKVADPRDFNADNVEEDRTVLIWIDKNRISSLQHAGFNLYFDYTTNYIDPNNKETYLDFGKPHNPYT